MGFLLFIVSLVLRRILEPVMFIYNGIIALFKGEWQQYNTDLAVAIDQYGNGLCKHLFNQILIKKSSTHKFGNIDETISSVLGKNKLFNTLTWLGRLMAYVLNLLEEEHVEKAIDNTEN